MQQTVLWIFVCSCFLARCEKFCPKGRHGVNCTSLCHCQNGGTCDPATGDCMCTAGWMGLVCGNRCPSGTYGTNCNFECDCNNEQQCDHINGSCICAPGYIGEKCQGTCPPGKYGPSCIRECHCENGVCDVVSVVCKCENGYHDKNCGEPCPNGYYGKDCASRCNCMNGDMCDVVKGECFCSPGYRGKNCGEPCPSGYYGKDCASRCNCMNGAMCDVVKGECFCSPGDNCDGLMTTERVPKVRKQKLGEAVLIIRRIFLVILVATILVIALKYYRRRVQSLKTQICNIHYTADPEASDRNNFDNPVYSFGSTITDVKNSNLDKEKKECYGVDPGFLKGPPANSILLKNKEVVYAIPYVYHTEDNLLDKDEHEYEEIKDSARNLSAHYHQMLNGIKKDGDQSSDNGSKTGGY